MNAKEKEYNLTLRKFYEQIKENPELYEAELDPDLPIGFGAYQLACKWAREGRTPK